MDKRIIDIEQYVYHGNTIRFAGTLRNEKEFELFQDVFILHDNKMYQCKIVGKELPPKSNPEFIYKIELPKELIEENRISRTCKNIFSSIEEAKESALSHLEMMYNLNKTNILEFFNQYENKKVK